MSKKTIVNLFHYASQIGSENFEISNHRNQVILDFHLPDGEKRSFSLPQKLELELLTNLRQISQINPGEFSTQKPVQLVNADNRLDFRITIIPDKNKERVIIDILNKNNQGAHQWRFNQLGWSRNQKKEILNFLSRRSGLLIVSSPIKQGKNTTAIALAEELNSADRNIYALIDFPDNLRTGINYVKQTPENWTRILRHDCELILIDSLETKDNLERALQAATTGRLVIGTIAADNVFEVLAKVMKVDLPTRLKLDSLKMITNQRLAELNNNLKVKKQNRRQTIALFEILKITPRLKKLLSDKPNLMAKKFWENLISDTIEEGFKPLELERQKKLNQHIIQ